MFMSVVTVAVMLYRFLSDKKSTPWVVLQSIIVIGHLDVSA